MLCVFVYLSLSLIKDHTTNGLSTRKTGVSTILHLSVHFYFPFSCFMTFDLCQLCCLHKAVWKGSMLWCKHAQDMHVYTSNHWTGYTITSLDVHTTLEFIHTTDLHVHIDISDTHTHTHTHTCTERDGGGGGGREHGTGLHCLVYTGRCMYTSQGLWTLYHIITHLSWNLTPFRIEI